MILPIDGEYFVRVVDMPYGIHGCVMLNDDGTHSVYINARDSVDRQRKAYKHELRHIINNDFAKHDAAEAEGL